MALREHYLVGVGKVEITPPLSVPYLGWFPRHPSFEGVHDSLYVRSVAISDGERSFCWVVADNIGFVRGLLGKGRDFIAEVRSRVSERTGIPSECVMVSASHIHSTPDTLCLRSLGDSPETLSWLESLVERIAESASHAAERQFEARLKVSGTNIEGISRNRNNAPYLDTEMVVLLFQAVDGDDRVVLVNYACHPVIVQVQPLVSADFVGVVQSTVESRVEGVRGCLFIQGACGDINPLCGDTRDFRDVDAVGLRLVEEVARVCAEMDESPPSDQPVKVDMVSRAITVPSRPLPSDSEIAEHTKNIECLAHWKDENGVPPDDSLFSAEVMQRVSEGNEPFYGEVQIARVGNILIVGTPFELFNQIGSEIKRMLEPFIAISACYTNGYLGYVATPDYWKGTAVYEVQCGPWSKVGPEAYSLVMNTVKTLGAEVIGGNELREDTQ